MNVRGERILIFGDSLSSRDGGTPSVTDATPSMNSAAPGIVLASTLLNQGAQAVRAQGRVGRSAYNFYQREAAASILAADQAWQPSKVIIMLGTNDIATGISMQADRQAMAALRDSYKNMGAEVWAVGPFASTLTSKSQPVVDMMRDVFGGRFIDGHAISQYAEHVSDGIHYTAAGANALGPAIADALLSKPSPTVVGTVIAIGLGAVAVIGGAVLWSKHKRGVSLAGMVDVVDGKRWNGSTNELIRKGYKQIACSSGLDKKGLARCWRGLSGPTDDQKYRVMQQLVVKRGDKFVTVGDVVAAPRALTLDEATKWRRKYKNHFAWIETMDGTFVPVKGAMRMGKHIQGYRREGEYSAALTEKVPAKSE